MAFTLALNSQPTAPAGRGIRITATRSGGTAWTNVALSLVAPLTVAGITGAYIDKMTVTGGNSCDMWFYTGDATGMATFTDTNGDTQTLTVTGTQPAHPVTGTTRYVKGGLPNVGLPTYVVNGTKGSTNYIYQIIALNTNGLGATGKTKGQVTRNKVFANIGATSAAIQSAYRVETRIATINNAPDSMDGTSNISLSWNPVFDPDGTVAASYDIIRSPDAGTTYYLVANQAGTTYTDQNSDALLALPVYTLPTANTTAMGNDTTGTGATGTPYATIQKAYTVSTAGDGIIIRGFVSSSGLLSMTDGIQVDGEDPNTAALSFDATAGSSTAHFPFRIPSSARVKGITFWGELSQQVVVGCGTADTAMTDCIVDSCQIRGTTNAFRLAAANCGITLIDSFLTSLHGTIGMVNTATNCVLNIIRTTSNVAGPTQNAAPICMQMNGGYVVAREVSLTGTLDSQQTNGAGLGVTIADATIPKALVMINSKVDCPQADFSLTNTTLLAGVRLKNTPYNKAKNPTLIAYAGLIEISKGTRLTDPLDLAGGGSAATSGGNFRSNQSAVTSGGIFGELRT